MSAYLQSPDHWIFIFFTIKLLTWFSRLRFHCFNCLVFSSIYFVCRTIEPLKDLNIFAFNLNNFTRFKYSCPYGRFVKRIYKFKIFPLKVCQNFQLICILLRFHYSSYVIKINFRDKNVFHSPNFTCVVVFDTKIDKKER